MLEVISAGIGVQSTTMMLMAAHGEIEPMPDLAIFADTKGESAATYEHLEWLRSGNVLPFPLEVVSWFSNLEDDIFTHVAAGEDAGTSPIARGSMWRVPMTDPECGWLHGHAETGMHKRPLQDQCRFQNCIREHLDTAWRRQARALERRSWYASGSASRPTSMSESGLSGGLHKRHAEVDQRLGIP